MKYYYYTVLCEDGSYSSGPKSAIDKADVILFWVNLGQCILNITELTKDEFDKINENNIRLNNEQYPFRN